MTKQKRIEIMMFYLVLTLSIFLMSIFLLSSLSHNFLKTLVRMGVIPPLETQTFSWEISPENLQPGSVVAYKSYAQDVDGNWRETELKIFSVESGTTSSSTTTKPTTTLSTTTPCIPIGGSCKLDEECCSRVCSSSECIEPLGDEIFNWWYLITIPILIVIILVIFWMKSSRETEEDEFEKLKEKWSRSY